jgi:hypothetical protein
MEGARHQLVRSEDPPPGEGEPFRRRFRDSAEVDTRLGGS